jgi:3D (Asp-Asp-Asp) domain-containing protein
MNKEQRLAKRKRTNHVLLTFTILCLLYIILVVSLAIVFGQYQTHYKDKLEQAETLVKQKQEILASQSRNIVRLSQEINEQDKIITQLEQRVAELQKIKHVSTPLTSRGVARPDFERYIAQAGQWTDGWHITYYTADYESTGKTPDHPAYGITKSGKRVRDNLTAAVDPKVIPLGTLFQVRLKDGTIYNLEAQDIGGAIKGKDVDIFVSDISQSKGSQIAEVRILKYPERK